MLNVVVSQLACSALLSFSIFDLKKDIFSAYCKEGARQHDCIQPCTFMRIQYGFPFSEPHSTNKTGEQTFSKGEAWGSFYGSL
jgi:hypothetical protein